MYTTISSEINDITYFFSVFILFFLTAIVNTSRRMFNRNNGSIISELKGKMFFTIIVLAIDFHKCCLSH